MERRVRPVTMITRTGQRWRQAGPYLLTALLAAGAVNALRAAEIDGKRVYEAHCAGCHGANGDGQGIAARFLYPRPRDFRSSPFRLVSTNNGVPTLEDLEAVLVRGMPGSSMPPWPTLTKEERRAVAEHLLELRKQGMRDREKAAAEDAGEDYDADATEELIKELMTPGDAIEVGAHSPANAAAIARGKALYAKTCASCHGETGKGDGQQKMIDVDGFATRPRDLTLGIYKGDPSYDSVYRRVLAGMPGTPMPSSKLTPEEVGDVTQFVLSLSSEEQRAGVVMARRQVVAKRLESIPELTSPKWSAVRPVSLATTPLWWRDDAVRSVDVQTAHDGKTLAVRLQWADATPNEHALKPEEFEDMVAVELFQGKTEPFLGMGSAEASIDLWQWRGGAKHAGESLSLLDEYPFDTPVYQKVVQGKDRPDFLTARAAGNPLATASAGSNLTAKGPGSVTFVPKASQFVKAEGAWSSGKWTVLLTRPLKVGQGEGVSLAPSGRASLAAAVWDGAARDRAAQKAITIWHDLVIE